MLRINKSITIFFDFYLQFLIFSIINRSFIPLNIDLRFIVVGLAIILIVLSLFSILNVKIDKNMILVLILYGLVIVSFFIKNTVNVDSAIYKNLIILNLYCFFNIMIVFSFSTYINTKKVWKYLSFAWYFLFFSVIFSALGFKLPFNDYKASYISNVDVGSGIRFSGYGTDPNYVCIIAIVIVIFTYAIKTKTINKLFIYFTALIAIILTRSRSALVIAVLLLIASYFDKFLSKNIKKIIISFTFVSLGIIPIIMLLIKPFNNNISMALRYDLWQQTFSAFLQHPLFGNGLMSGRNIAFYNLNWFVQCHSTYFQLLCDNGIFALFVYFAIYYFNVVKNIDNPLKYIFLLYFAWSFTYETMYLTYTILFLGILPYCLFKNKGMSK